MKRLLLSGFLTAALLACFPPRAGADVQLPSVLGSHMVLQRDKPLTIWGWADPGEEVKVRISDKSASTKADGEGNWKVALPAMKADGKAHTLTVSGKNKVELTDVLIGEVWVGSGQSNMEWPLSKTKGMSKGPIASADHPKIRLCQVPRPRPRPKAPARDVKAAWQVCGPKTAGRFSGVLYYFGLRLHEELKVPVGLINSSVGGSAIEPWTVTRKTSGRLYNGMIAPLTPLPVRGVVWYQGEANVTARNGLKYRDKMEALIEGWRGKWGKDLPFYFVQIAPWAGRYAPGELPALWEAQVAALKIPRTGMVVTTDLVDDLKDIHPRNKKDVGNRLALWALAKDYGRKALVYSGPLYRSLKVDGGKVRLSFAHVGGGLKARDGKPLSEFEIAGADGKFVPAEAVIDGETVVVSARGVKNPTQVRFGWRKTANPNLMNKEGLPASPFRTHNWQGGTGEEAPKTLALKLRSRVQTKESSGRFHTVVRAADWDPRKTAIIVCDMWDLHHCLNATKRVGEMAPRMNKLLNEARRRGVLIIHAPSSCMSTYKDHPARRRALRTPRGKSLPRDIGKWCRSIPAEEKGKYPIDQADGGEDDDPAEHKAWAAKLEGMGRNPRAPWKSQIDVLKIDNADVISDSGEEIWSVLEHGKVDNVILVGVHTNMCVLGRPFGLRQMARNGKKVVLMRDMTDTMYNPARAPFVSHFTGTDLIVEHIEKWVCPTVTSDQILGGKPFRFAGDRRPHVVLVMAEDEYRTERTLPEFARKHLGKAFRVSEVYASEKDKNDLPGIEVLDEADLAVFSVRRRVLPPKQMAVIRKFVAAGKPVVGLRTASHAFSPAGKRKVPKGYAAWPEFDAEVFGGHYTGHHGAGPKVKLEAAKGASGNAILAGVDVGELRGHGSLYKVRPLAKSATPLLIGSIPERPAEPVAWVNTTKAKGRVFYTSLGHPDDFKQAGFNALLRNAVYWAASVPRSKPRKGG
jgi:sialate O-acetylesterase